MEGGAVRTITLFGLGRRSQRDPRDSYRGPLETAVIERVCAESRDEPAVTFHIRSVIAAQAKTARILDILAGEIHERISGWQHDK